MQKNLKEKLINRKIKKPNPILMAMSMCVLGFLCKLYRVRFNYDYDPESIKGQPTILLSSHASRLEFVYTLYGFGRLDVNMVCGYQNILKKGMYHIFLGLGVISKYLYQPDVTCVRHMLKVLRWGGTLGLFPEGIQSSSGSTHPINPATAQFIKHSKANVVIATSQGAYLATNRYSSDRKKGYIGINYSLVFTPDMLRQMSEEQIYQLMLQKISYNDFEFNKVARHKYVGKKPNAFGIDKILYKCPDCEEEYTLLVDDDTVVCTKCGFSVKINEYYDIIGQSGKMPPADIDAWYKWQRNCVREQINNEEFELTMRGKLCTLKIDKLAKPPKNTAILSVGDAKLTRDGLCFTGKLDGQIADFAFPAKSIYSMTFSTKGFLEFYINNDYYMLIPDNKEQCLIKWTLASEEIHNLYDAAWRNACADVYNYKERVTNE